MKLLRYGPTGHQKPGLLDGTGVLRDLSGEIPDLGPAEISTDLDRIKSLNPSSLHQCRAPHVSARSCPGWVNSLPSGSTTAITRQNPTCPFRSSPSYS